MRVFELMEALAKYPAGAEVKVAVGGTHYTTIDFVEHERNVHICGDDAQVADDDGVEIARVSQITEHGRAIRRLVKGKR